MLPQQEALDHYARFHSALEKVACLTDQGQLDAALQHAHDAASYAWTHACGIFVSASLEEKLARISEQLPDITLPTARSGQRRVLTIMSSIHAVGGHSRIAWRWFQLDTRSRHTLVLTQQGPHEIPAQILALQQQGTLDLVVLTEPNWLAHVQTLRHHIADADQVVLLTHPNDITPCAALPGMRTPPPVIFMDHAGHTFWLGVTISCQVLGMSPILHESRRGIPKEHISWVPLPLDFSRLDAPAAVDVRAALRIPAEAVLLMSCGMDYKYLPIDGVCMADLLAPVLGRHPQAHLLVVGVQSAALWEDLAQRYPGRIHLQSYLSEPELVACYQACDIYLDSIPFASPTTMFEAAACGKPVVRYAPADWRACGFSLDIDTIPTSLYIWSQPAHYEKDLDRLIDEPGFRAWRGQFGQRAVRLYHAEDTFVHAVEAAYERAIDMPRIKVNAEAVQWRYGRLDELLASLTRNQFHGNHLEAKRRVTQQPHQELLATVSLQHTAYQRWLADRPNRSTERDAAPTGTLLLQVAIAAGDPQAAAATRQSLQAQSRQADSVVSANADGSWVEALDVSPRSWTLLLAPGDTLEVDALARLEQAVAAAYATGLNLVYSDHDELDGSSRPEHPFFKPDFNPDLLLCYPYVGRALMVRNDWARPLLGDSGGRFDLTLAYRLALSALAENDGAAFRHVALPLLHLNPAMPTVFCNTSDDWQTMAGVLHQHLQAQYPGAQMVVGPGPGTFHVVPPLSQTPLVSIVIPTRDQLPFLSRSIETLLAKTDYPEYEIIVVDNDSQTTEAQAFLSGLEQVDSNRIRVLRVPGPFNFSRMNNLAVAQARGEFILMLNNDTAVLHADWLTHMMRHALRDGVGIVGARLVYPEGTVQHAGVIMGLRGPADHPCLGLKPDEPGYMFRAQLTQNFSAVTAACMLVSKAVYEEVGGLDEEDFAVSYNDVDFCLKVGQTGRRIVWTPLATLLHEGSASQKASIENLSQANKSARFSKEQAAMYRKWPEVIANDPAYNPNLSLVERGYEVETNPLLCYDPMREFYEHKVVAFAADPYGCGNYRILQPMQAMLDDDLCIGGASPEIFGPNLALRSRADVLVFQRPTSDAGIQTLESLIPLKGVKKIFEVDDNLTRVPYQSVHHKQMPTDIRKRMIKSIGLCDRLIVSTQPLAEEFKHANDDVRVVLNRLPPAMWGEAPPVTALRDSSLKRKPVVAWAGGVGHGGDLALVAQVVKELADVVDWEFFGMCPDAIRPYVKRVHAGVPTLEYPAKLMQLAQNWDLAIAPLEVNAFNESKSNLRLLEYGWCGLPVVCSDVTPYQDPGFPVTRVKNRYKDWKAAILERVNDLESTRQQGLALQAVVQRDWMLQGEHVVNWYKAWTD